MMMSSVQFLRKLRADILSATVTVSIFSKRGTVRCLSQRADLDRDLKIVEVGPRDGLQNETKRIPTDVKVEFVNSLAKAGFPVVEVASFVSPKRVPQMADGSAVLLRARRHPPTRFSALTPNLRGFEAAIAAGVDEVAIFGAASETFSRKNINASIDESLKRFEEVTNAAVKLSVPVRGYVSCVLGCPYEGSVQPSQVASVAEKMAEMGCYEVSLGDTIGVGTPDAMVRLLEAVRSVLPVSMLAVHCHDTYGQAIANIYAAIKAGVRVVDSAAAGLGGCPFAPGASGNVASEDVLYLAHGLGLRTGVGLDALLDASRYITRQLGTASRSRAGPALARARRTAGHGPGGGDAAAAAQ